MASKVSPIPIADYFAGQHIFITGGTGFMGKVLVEKILRCCPGVAKIYLMIRPKKEMTIEQRWDKMKNIELFNQLNSSNPDAMNKIQLIQGDITKENLGLSGESLKILEENVTIVYHVAAMIQFTELLVEAINTNAKSTHVLLEMAMNMRNLKIFLHVSTAFCNSNLPCEECVEEVLPAVHDWKVLLKVTDREPATIAFLKEKLMCGHPNPYTFSKSIAEQIVDDYKAYFPTIIMRPAQVGPCMRDPIGGWADILCGYCAVSLPIILGLIRVVQTSGDFYQDAVAVDTAINAVILATAKRLQKPMVGQTDVYNCAHMKDRTMTVSDMVYYGLNVLREKYPSKYTLWNSHAILTTNEFCYKILSLFLNVLPAIVMDLFLIITFNKPVVLKLVKKFSNICRVFKKFTISKIAFPNEKFKELEDFLPDDGKENFTISIEGYSVADVVTVSYMSMLKYFLKEDTSEEAFTKNRRKLYWLKVLDKLVIYGLCIVCAWCTYKLF